jgi:hypothetical protein
MSFWDIVTTGHWYIDSKGCFAHCAVARDAQMDFKGFFVHCRGRGDLQFFAV